MTTTPIPRLSEWISASSDSAAVDFAPVLRARKERLAPAREWYPYETLNNFHTIEELLTGDHRDMSRLLDNGPIADIGAADGDLSFLLQSIGYEVDIIDNGATNWNGLRGARLLADDVGEGVTVYEIDLDAEFRLPRQYGVAFFLGILYHLQNPFYALLHLAESARYAFLSTRIAQVTADGAVRLDRAPVAYLLAADECNNDATNYWIFSDAGLRRLLDRTGWEVIASTRGGCIVRLGAGEHRAGRARLLLPAIQDGGRTGRVTCAERAPISRADSLPEVNSLLERDPDRSSMPTDWPAFSPVAAPVASIVVPVHGKWPLTLACLRSLARCGDEAPFEIVVVDDQSPDDSLEWLARVEGIRIVSTPENVGFVRACNLGASHASADVLVFLNNDTEVHPGWLDRLLEVLDEDPTVGVVGPMLLDGDGLVQESGSIIWADGTGWNFGRGEHPSFGRRALSA